MKMKTMHKSKILRYLCLISLALGCTRCIVPHVMPMKESISVPATFTGSADSTNSAKIKWSEFFRDDKLNKLVGIAIENNQELKIVLQEITIMKNEARVRKGAYLPFLDVGAGAAVEKSGRYTRTGAVEATTDIMPGKMMPEPLGDFVLSANFSWEADIWKKLHNLRKAAVSRYLSTVEGRNFMVTQLVAEIAGTYYELLGLDNQLDLIRQNIEIQNNALEIAKLQKQSARITELAVKRFEAQLLNTRGLQFDVQQKITEAENRINFLIARFPQPVERNSMNFLELRPDTIFAGVPAQYLENRPDIREAKLRLAAAKLELKSARAEFYPSLFVNASVGLQTFNPAYFAKLPESLFYMLAGDLLAPVINRNAIIAAYYSANARQSQAVHSFERSIIRAHTEVINQINNVRNLGSRYDLKKQQVQALTESTEIANVLFKSARADYMEVLLTQRDALESRMELVEIRTQQMKARVEFYKSLGGGW
jgi:outer membrane protein, multidrug efflux system